MQPADKDYCTACDYSEPDSFDERIARPQLIMLLVNIVVWWIIVAFIDGSLWKLFVRVPVSQKEHGEGVDLDIIEEENEVKKSTVGDLPIRIYGANKTYTTWKDNCKMERVEAVKRVSVGLKPGDCFALLGISGAGKTTMFKMITGEITPTAGQMSIKG